MFFMLLESEIAVDEGGVTIICARGLRHRESEVRGNLHILTHLELRTEDGSLLIFGFVPIILRAKLIETGIEVGTLRQLDGGEDRVTALVGILFIRGIPQLVVLRTERKFLVLVAHEGGQVGRVLHTLFATLVHATIEAHLETLGRGQRDAHTVVQAVVRLNLLVALAIDHNHIGRKPVGKFVGGRETQIGTATELVLVLERL